MESGLWNTVVADDIAEIIREPVRLMTATLLTGKKATVKVTDPEGNTFVIAHLNEARPTANISNIIIDEEFQLSVIGSGASVDVLGQLEVDEIDHDGDDMEDMDEIDESMMEFDEEAEDSEEDEEAKAAFEAAIRAESKKAKKMPEPTVEKKESPASKKDKKQDQKKDIPSKQVETSKKDQQKEPAKKKKEEKKPSKPIDVSAEKKAAEAALAVVQGLVEPAEKPKKRSAVEAAASPSSSKVLNLSGGVKVEILRPGNGKKEVVNRSKVSIRYVGSLASNGKVFDKGNFSMVVGKGESIKGFEVGVMGAIVGETRKVFIPARMAYGSKKLPGIPANSDLIFEMSIQNVQ